MKKIKIILSVAAALSVMISALHGYAADIKHSLVAANECTDISTWTTFLGEGNTAVISNETLVINRTASGYARAAWSPENVSEDCYIEAKLKVTGTYARMYVYDNGQGAPLLTYVDISATDGTVKNDRSSQTVEYTAGNDVVIGIYMKASTKTFDMYVDGTKFISGGTMREIYSGINRIQFDSDANNKATSAITTVDYVRIYNAESVAPTVSNVGISGIAASGSILEASYTYADADGDAEGTSTYQWYRADSENGSYSAISGAVGKTYTIASSDKGKFIKVAVTPVDDLNTTGTAVDSYAIEVPEYVTYSTVDGSDWSVGGVGENRIANNSGGYIGAGTTNSDSYGFMQKGNLDINGDFTVEFEAYVPTMTGQNSSSVTLLNMRQSDRDFIYINYYINGNNENVIRVITSDGNKQIAKDLSDGWHRIKMAVDKSALKMTIYVDGETEVAWTDMNPYYAYCTSVAPMTWMRVGMTSSGTTTSADVRVKNMAIYQPQLSFVSETAPVLSNGAYTYSAKIWNADASMLNYPVVLAVYDGNGRFVDADIYNSGFSAGAATDVSLSVSGASAGYTASVIKLDGFETLHPITIK